MNGKRLIVWLLLFMMLAGFILSLPSYGEEESNPTSVSNQAQTIIKYAEEHMPKEILSLEGNEELPLYVYARYAKFLHYTNELEILVNENPESLSLAKDSLEYYQNTIKSLAPEFEDMTNINEVSKYITDTSEKYVKGYIEEVLNSEGNGKEEYVKNFESIREVMRIWSDFIKFQRDEIGIEDAEYEEITKRFDIIYDGLTQVNKKTGMELNLGFLRPENVYGESASISTSIVDSEGNLQPWYMEVLALSAKINGEKLDDYVHLLSAQTKEKYDKYASARTPLYQSADVQPIKTLFNKGPKAIKISSLRFLIDNKDEEIVLYLPRQSKLDDLSGKPESLSNAEDTDDNEEEESEDEAVITEDNMHSEESNFVPIYIKGSKSPFLAANSKIGVMGDKEEGTLNYDTAMLNHLQFHNFYESGHLNDLTIDLAYPLFVDMFGNIQTYTGKIVVPGVANMTFMSDNSYFPMNAYFLNNYPKESDGKGLHDILEVNSDPNKYVVTVDFVEDFAYFEDDSVDVRKMLNSSHTLSKLKKSWFKNEFKLGSKGSNVTNRLPKIRAFIETGSEDNPERFPFMRVTTVGKGVFKKEMLGLKEQVVLDVDGTPIRFTDINEKVPAELWTFNYYFNKDGDRRRLKNNLLVEVANSAVNSNVDYDIFKMSDGFPKSKGFKLGSMLEPIHKTMSEAGKNYILYTPSVSELPGMNKYVSIFLMPVIKVLTLVALFLTILDAVRSPNLEWSRLIISLLIIFLMNWLVVNMYPAMLNIGFNGSVSRILGNKTHHLALYNIEKDLNSQPEFVYTETPTKIITDGAHIQLAELNNDEIKRFRAAEEDAPWKTSEYYAAKWDSNPVQIGRYTYLQGDSLNIYVKDLFNSAYINYDGSQYNLEWNELPDYCYYIPYLNILEGLTQTINLYTKGSLTPKVIKYENGYKSVTGGSLMYFYSKYFLVDELTAYSMKETNPEFYDTWKEVNNSDFLNLQAVMWMEQNEDLGVEPKFQFDPRSEFRTKTSRWYKVATNGRNEKDVQRKIKDINLSTRQYAMSLLPYMDNISDDVILKSIALYATQEFAKEFSLNPFEKFGVSKDYFLDFINRRGRQDYFTDLYPKKLELSTISLDEHMKLSIINVHDLLKFNVTSIYKYLELKSNWFGMLFFFLLEILMFVRSLMRISFITIIFLIILIYMMVVYAIRRDYSNKTVFGMLQLILISWFVYLVDNLLLLIFLNSDKSSPGVLILIIIIWFLWNVIATAIYVQLFFYIFRDLKAFGGSIFLENANTVLKGVTKVGQAMIRPFSETRANSFDVTNANWEVKQEEFEDYMNMTHEEKMSGIRDNMLDTGITMKDNAGQFIKEHTPKMKTIGEMYAEHQDEDYMEVSAFLIPQAGKDYLINKGLVVTDNPKDGVTHISGDMDKWKQVVEDHTIKSEEFGLYKEKDGELYFTPSHLSKDLLNKSGVEFNDLIDSYNVRGLSKHQINDLENSLKSPIYKANMGKDEALRKVSNTLHPSEYEIGKNAVYLNSEELARNVLGEGGYEKTFKTNFGIIDYSDRLNSGARVNPYIDIINGILVTREYVYGKVMQETVRKLKDEDVKLVARKPQTYQFDPKHRGHVVEALRSSARYTEAQEGIMFRDKTPIEKFIVWGDTAGDKNSEVGDKTKEDAKKIPSIGTTSSDDDNDNAGDSGDDSDDFIKIDLNAIED